MSFYIFLKGLCELCGWFYLQMQDTYSGIESNEFKK